MSLEDVLATRSATLLQRHVQPRAFTGYQRFTAIDRGSYDFIEAPDAPDLLRAAQALVDADFAGARIVRLHPGDYVLARADDPRRGTEVVFDLSTGSRPDGALQYRQHGQVFFQVPNQPGAAAIVPRTLSVSANHQYLSKLHTGDIVRWIGMFVAR